MRGWLMGAALVLALTGTPAVAAVSLVPVGNFSRPVFVTAPAGDVQRVFVVERGGVVKVVLDGVVQGTPFLDIANLVLTSTSPGEERGLLSMAFAPDYATSGRFYVFYTGRAPPATNGGNLMIDEFRSGGAAFTTADPATRRPVLQIPHFQAGNHNGGQLAFGPDGYLWLATGDGGGSNDEFGNGQNLGRQLGKLLRIDPRPGMALTPADNPFVGVPGDDLIWAYGLRNPFRFSFDRATGDLAIGDVGQGFVEEVDFVTKAGGLGRGANYGWNILEGNFLLSNQMPPAPGQIPAGYVGPVIQQFHSAGWCAVTGGYVVRDPALPELAGRYVYGDYCKGDIHAATLTPSGSSGDGPIGLNVPSLSSFGEDGCGRVYVASISGPVSRLASSGVCSGPAPVPFPVPPPPPGTDTTAPAITTTRPGRQRVAARGAVVRVACDEACAVRATGRVQFMQRGRLIRLSLRPTTANLAAGAPATLRLRVPVGSLPPLRRALASGRRVIVTMTVRAEDASGNVRFTRVGARVVP